MRARVVVLGAFIFGCGGGESTPIDAPDVDAVEVDATEIDASAVDAPVDSGPAVACNPLAAVGQQGCIAGQKCTWITVQDTPAYEGVLGCVPDGDVALNGSCLQGPAGESTGFDDCEAGLICVNGACRDVCGFDGSQSARCATSHNCTKYQTLFSNGEDEPLYGACNPGCDPLSQLRADGQPCGTGMGCYVLARQEDTIAVCASAGFVGHDQAAGGTAANECVPGAQLRQSWPGGGLECGGLCRPTDVTSTQNMTSEGGVSPYSCGERWGSADESCRYFWGFEPAPVPTNFSNTLGLCFEHADAQYDSNGDQVPDMAFPACTDLTTGDVLPPFGGAAANDARYFWCLARVLSLQETSSGTEPRASVALPRMMSGWRQ